MSVNVSLVSVNVGLVSVNVCSVSVNVSLVSVNVRLVSVNVTFKVRPPKFWPGQMGLAVQPWKTVIYCQEMFSLFQCSQGYRLVEFFY